MSNKFLIPIIIVLSLITIGVASITQLNKAPGKIGMNSNQSSEINSSVKTQVVSSSSSIQTNSSSAVSSIQNIVESVVAVNSVKAESQPVVSNTAKCNLPESENLVKTEDGCFRLINNSDSENQLSKDLSSKISIDYYKKIFKYLESDTTQITINYRHNSKEYPIYMYSEVKKSTNEDIISGQNVFNTFYNLNNGDIKFLFFELRGDGRTQNIEDVINRPAYK